jgi:tripartite-type tricarboxylate transporter receptor subunit TctC
VVIVVPSSPGGSLDAGTRIISVKLGELWKQPVVVENKPGANFAIGAAQVARAPADGYTLLYAHDGALAINPVLYPNLSYNPLTELTPVGRVVDLPLVLYVPKDSPFHSVADLIKSLRAAPGKYNHASGGTATMMVSELFKSVAAVDYTDVPYKGGGPAVVAVAGGEADFTFADPGSAAAMLATGRIHGLATASAKRLRLQPDLPTIAETVPAYSAVSWSGLHAPAGTPPEIIRKINADLAKVLAMPDVRKRLDDLGVEVNPSTPEELHQQIVADTERWKQLVKTRHISIQ